MFKRFCPTLSLFFLLRGLIVRFVFYFSRAIANELGLLFDVDNLN